MPEARRSSMLRCINACASSGSRRAIALIASSLSLSMTPSGRLAYSSRPEQREARRILCRQAGTIQRRGCHGVSTLVQRNV